MTKRQLGAKVMLYPVPVVLLASSDREGNLNVMTVAWAGVANSDPPVIGVAIRPSRHSHAMIQDVGQFTVNVPTVAQLREADRAGLLSGRHVDKFAALGLTPEKSRHLRVPVIRECPVNVECKLRQVVNLGSHDLFLGEVVEVHADASVLDQNGNFDASKVSAFCYVLGEYWSLGERLGRHGFTRAQAPA